jgi:hypothetical protein
MAINNVMQAYTTDGLEGATSQAVHDGIGLIPVAGLANVVYDNFVAPVVNPYSNPSFPSNPSAINLPLVQAPASSGGSGGKVAQPNHMYGY